MKTKKKLRTRIFAFLALSLVLVSVLGISTFAFQYETLNDAGSFASFDHDLSEPIYTDDYTILPVGGLILENMQGMIGSVDWKDYGRLSYGFDYLDYITNTKDPVYALEFLVVRCEIDQIMNDHTYTVVSDGNFYFPDMQKACYYTNGFRVCYIYNTLYYSFLDNFVSNYVMSYSDYQGLEKYQMYCVVYHYDIGTASPGTTVSMKKYEELNDQYKAEKVSRETAEKELTKSREKVDALTTEKDALTADKAKLEMANKTLEENVADLNVKLESTANAGAVANFFDGIYQAVSGTLNTFFDLDIFGVSLGSIIAVLLGALVVIVVLKLVL